MEINKEQPKGEIVIYKAPEGPELQVKLQDETVWLSLQQMADLFGRDKSVISRHVKNIYKEAELSQNSTVANFATARFAWDFRVTTKHVQIMHTLNI